MPKGAVVLNYKNENRIWVKAAFFLAVAVILQSLRLLLPMPGPVNVFVIGSLVNMTLLVAMDCTKDLRLVVIGLLLPAFAFMGGALPLVPMIPVVGLGNALFMCWAKYFGRSPLIWLAPLVKALFLWAGTWLVIFGGGCSVAAAGPLLFMMSWPQVVTGMAGIFLARILLRRIPGQQ